MTVAHQLTAPGADASIGEGNEPLWAAPPTHRARADVQRAVRHLLDALAPERTLTRALTRELTGPVTTPRALERHRTPRGCILQAATAAVSVSWFPDADTDLAFGSLEVTCWSGVVSRPGATRRAPGGATVTRVMTLHPVPADALGADKASEWLWREADGTTYGIDELVGCCLELAAA